MATGVGPSPPLAAGGGAWSAEAAGLTSSWATSITFFFFFFFFAPNSNCSCETQHTCTLSDHVTRQRARPGGQLLRGVSEIGHVWPHHQIRVFFHDTLSYSTEPAKGHLQRSLLRQKTHARYKFQLMHTQHPLQLERTNKTWSKKRDALLLFSE